MRTLEIEYECYSVRSVDRGSHVCTPAPREERELIAEGEEFGDVLAEAVDSIKITMADRLEFKAIDQDTGNDWHIRRIDLTEAVEDAVRDKLQILNNAVED